MTRTRPPVRPRPAEHRAGPRVPLVLALPAAAAVLVLLLPLVALVSRAPWSGAGTVLAAPEVGQALWLSLRCATAATLLSLVLGVPLAWVLARADLPGTGVLRALVTLPVVLPPVVGGVALLMLLGRRGLLGAHLDAWFGVTVPFTTVAVVLAETFVALPFLVLSVEGTLRAAPRGADEAAAVLGADRWYTFRRVTLPRVAPGVVAGAVLCFARALGEFGATVTFAGSFPGTTRTMPLAIQEAMERDPDAAVALSLLLVALSLVALVALHGRWAGRVLG
ncbi:ABC transporter permease [Cellulomonas triticagri]|uniref:Molybdenum transport system permease n=1 Tax=Cellulomonas triticagri TaxID=2483352 RepID=A0A3M2J4X7_9CELL|nr:ABC transporter permease [Cellulomonas triticagri]RMI09142.1 molybdate ABC transporter permease subunit [Cellulomonas triticagri]